MFRKTFHLQVSFLSSILLLNSDKFKFIALHVLANLFIIKTATLFCTFCNQPFTYRGTLENSELEEAHFDRIKVYSSCFRTINGIYLVKFVKAQHSVYKLIFYLRSFCSRKLPNLLNFQNIFDWRILGFSSVKLGK